MDSFIQNVIISSQEPKTKQTKAYWEIHNKMHNHLKLQI